MTEPTNNHAASQRGLIKHIQCCTRRRVDDNAFTYIHECSNNDMATIDTIRKTLLEKVDEFSRVRADLTCTVRPLHATKSKDNFASIIYVADLTNNKTKNIVSVVVKVLPDNLRMREIQNSSIQFYNEDVIFQQVVPLMIKYCGSRDTSLVSSLFPKCYYASHGDDNAMVVLDNLTVDGYVLTDQIMDYEHCRLTFEGLARFHALSYAMKHNQNALFQKEVVGVIREARYTDHFRRKFNNVFLQNTSMDPIHFIRKAEDKETVAFRKKHEHFLNKLEEAFEYPAALLESMMVPEEPLSVLCHGDFNRNNLMYRHDDKGKPTHMKLLDFQTVRYANPSIDIVFFVYFNTSAEFRKKHLDGLMRVYQKTVVDCLVEATDCTRDYLESVYSLDAFREDFECRAIYGYVISAMFIHFMLASVEELMGMEKWMQSPEQEDVPAEGYLKDVLRLGGDEAMKRSVAIIKEIAQMKRNC